MSRATDNDNYVLVANLDLSAAFDSVKIDILIKGLRIIGIQSDDTNLILNWLRG